MGKTLLNLQRSAMLASSLLTSVEESDGDKTEATHPDG